MLLVSFILNTSEGLYAWCAVKFLVKGHFILFDSSTVSSFSVGVVNLPTDNNFRINLT